jgi:hypothetical protein
MLQASYTTVPRIGPNYKNLAFLTITFLGLGILIWKVSKLKKDEENSNL